MNVVVAGNKQRWLSDEGYLSRYALQAFGPGPSGQVSDKEKQVKVTVVEIGGIFRTKVAVYIANYPDSHGVSFLLKPCANTIES